MPDKNFEANKVVTLLNKWVEDSDAVISIKFVKKIKKIVNEPQMTMELKRNILKMLIPYIEKELEKNNLVNYDPLGCMDNEIELIDAEKVISTDSRDEANVNYLAEINEKKFDWGSVDYYVVSVEKGEEVIKLYRQFPKLRRLRKGIFLQAFMDELVQMESEFIGLDESVDILEWEGKLIVFNHIALERIFGYKDLFERNTVTALSIIRENNIFADMDMFEQDCMRNVRIMKRLTSVVLKNRLKLFFDNYDKVPEIVKENNLKIDFDAEGKIVYKDKTELYRITNLMADSYFRSLLLDRLGVAKLEGNMEE